MKCFSKLSSAVAIAGMLCFIGTASAQDGTVPFEKLQSGWHQKAIPVDDGQAKPGIDRLATAFCEAWQTGICHSVARYLRNPKHYSSTYSRNYEIGYSINIDQSNGSMNATDENDLSPYFYATLWRRSNGHTLLGINTGKPVDPNVDVVLFYDYDPDTRLLVPEKTTSDYVTLNKHHDIRVNLPMEGKDVHLIDCSGEEGIEYTFRFNGMGFDEPASSVF